MGQLIAIALGGASGAVLRFFVSNGVYTWLGREFPYGTLTVNLLGSFLMGLLTEALILQKVALSLEFRSAILIGMLGSFTTFSTFSLDTLYLIEQGNLSKAALNVMVSVCVCVFAVWLGLLTGRGLFSYSGGVVKWMDLSFPYALITVNALLSFLIGVVMTVLIHKVALPMEYRAAIMIIVVGVLATFSSLYLCLSLIEDGHSLDVHIKLILGILIANASVCSMTLWLGFLTGKQI